MKKKYIDNIKTIIYAFLTALFIKSFFYEPFHIPSSSMEPNLLPGDYIFASKMKYGYSRYSFPLSLPIFEGRIFQMSKPEVGDVIIFRLPNQEKINYIKRVIGLPGDKIQLINSKLFINDKLVKRKYSGTIYGKNLYKEILPNKKEISILEEYGNELPQDNTGYYIVPEGHYFVMGDNRDNSQDSRFSSKVGFIPEENIVGKASMIFFSFKGSIFRIYDFGIRLSRSFKKIS